jgi:hypothetical protein
MKLTYNTGMSSFDKYLGSYERISPSRGQWQRRVQKLIDRSEKGQQYSDSLPKDDKNKEWTFEVVTPENYPDLYGVVTEECELRGIERPRCYVTDNPNVKLGKAAPSLYEIYIKPLACKISTKKELRGLVAHEIKHLYQGKTGNINLFSKKELFGLNLKGIIRHYQIQLMRHARHMEAEFDCDRSVVESTDLETARSFIDKAIHQFIDEKVPTKMLREFLHRFYDSHPDFILENAIYPLDKYHPSPAARWLNIKEHSAKILLERALQEQGQGQDQNNGR